MKRLKEIGIAILIAIAIFGGCSLNKNRSRGKFDLVNTEVVVDTVFVDVEHTSIEYVPIATKEYVTTSDTIYVNNEVIVVEEKELSHADTLEIMSEYYTKRFYSDTLETEYGNIVVEDQIWKNNIYSRQYSYNLQVPEVHTTIKKEFMKKKNRFDLYVGGSTILQPNNQVHIAQDFLPSLFIGGGYDLGKGHSIYYERDLARKDNRITYEYDRNKWEAFGTYSTQYKYTQIGLKFYIIK